MRRDLALINAVIFAARMLVTPSHFLYPLASKHSRALRNSRDVRAIERNSFTNRRGILTRERVLHAERGNAKGPKVPYLERNYRLLSVVRGNWRGSGDLFDRVEAKPSSWGCLLAEESSLATRNNWEGVLDGEVGKLLFVDCFEGNCAQENTKVTIGTWSFEGFLVWYTVEKIRTILHWSVVVFSGLRFIKVAHVNVKRSELALERSKFQGYFQFTSFWCKMH